MKHILTRIGDKIGLDLEYFLKNGFWIFIRYIVMGLSGLAISISFTRLGTKELFGQYQFILNFLAFFSFFSLPGLNTVALREVALKRDEIVRKAVNKSFFWSLLAIPVIVCYGTYQVFFGDALIGKTLILAGILFPFFYAPNTWYTFFEGKKMFRASSIRLIVSNILLALAMVAALHWRFGLFWTVFLFLFVNILMNGIFYLEVLRKISEFGGKLDLKYGLSCTVQKFTYSFSESVPVLAIYFLFGFESLAIYQIAYFLISLVAGFIAALSATYMPLLFKNIKIDHFKMIWQNLLIGLIFFVGFIVFIKLFFFVFYGKDYQDSYSLVKIFSFVIIFIPLRVYFFNFYAAKNKNKFLIISNIVSNVIALVVFLLIKKNGFTTSVFLYFYLFSLLTIAPLIINYFLMASKKTDSILSEII
jgi:O-antigen/teichoic acid export membrane protein